MCLLPSLYGEPAQTQSYSDGQSMRDQMKTYRLLILGINLIHHISLILLAKYIGEPNIRGRKSFPTFLEEISSHMPECRYSEWQTRAKCATCSRKIPVTEHGSFTSFSIVKPHVERGQEGVAKPTLLASTP